jgi:hypothetical protein
MENNRDFYLITGGAVEAAFDRWHAKFKEQQAARLAFRTEFGADGVFANRHGLAGLVFENDKPGPAGWKKDREYPEVWKPHGRGHKEVRERMKNLPLVSNQEFQDEVMGKDSMFHFMDGLVITWMTLEKVGSCSVLHVPKCGKFEPPDEFCNLLKTSEYWLLKEAQEVKEDLQ